MKKKQVWGVIFYIVCFVILILVMNWSTVGENMYLGSRDVSIESYGWNLTVNEEERGKIALPLELREEKEVKIAIEKEIRFSGEGEQYICFRSTQNAVKVYLDDNQVYSYDNSGEYSFSKSPGSVWNFIKLPVNEESYKIKIVLSSPYKMFSGLVMPVYTGDEAAIYTYLLRKYAPNFLLGFVYVLISLFVLFSNLSFRKTKMTSGFAFAIMIFHLGVWFLIESKLDQFIFDKPYLFTQLKVILVVTFPAVFLYYICSLDQYKKDLYLEWCFRGALICVAVFGVCDLQELWDAVEMVPLVGIFYFLIVFGLLKNIFIYCWKKRNIRAVRLQDISLVCVAVAALHDMVYKYFSTNLPNGKWFFTAVFIFILIIFNGFKKEYLELYIMQVEDKNYRELAYKDVLTGMANRTAFEEKMQQLRTGNMGSKEINVVIIDINNLKSINDTLGHKMGDKAIIQVGKAIQSHLSKYGTCYRIGGDEFCIIIHKIRGIKLKYILDKLAQDIMSEDFVDGFQLSIACGFQGYNAETSGTIDDALTKADENMYSCKQDMKKNVKKQVDRI